MRNPYQLLREKWRSITLSSVVNGMKRYKGPRPLKVVVTGSPRSGTSFVAGLIHRMGFSLGPKRWLKTPDEHNPHGYFECIPLMEISNRILDKLGADFHHNLPSLEPGWTEGLESEKQDIVNIIETGGIELYKGNRLLVLADLYDELFPEAKWIFIRRDVEETYESRFGEPLTFEKWKQITNRRLQKWYTSRPSADALYVDYRDFKDDIEESIRRIQSFLGVDLDKSQFQACIDFYRPRN